MSLCNGKDRYMKTIIKSEIIALCINVYICQLYQINNFQTSHIRNICFKISRNRDISEHRNTDIISCTVTLKKCKCGRLLLLASIEKYSKPLLLFKIGRDR